MKKTTRWTRGSVKPMAASRKKMEKMLNHQKKQAVGYGKASLVQREVSAEQADGGIAPMQFSQESWKRIWDLETIPQSKIKDFCQPPLHKGAFTQLASVLTRLTRHARNRGLCPLNDNHRLGRWMCFCVLAEII